MKHHELDLPNLHVAKAMLSLKSRGYVREVFNWCVAKLRCRWFTLCLYAPPSPPCACCYRQWHYYFLTDEGIAYLRAYLHLPEEIVPATLKKVAGAPSGMREEGGREGGWGDRERGDRPRRDFGDRPPRRDDGEGYRRSAPASAATA